MQGHGSYSQIATTITRLHDVQGATLHQMQTQMVSIIQDLQCYFSLMALKQCASLRKERAVENQTVLNGERYRLLKEGNV